MIDTSARLLELLLLEIVDYYRFMYGEHRPITVISDAGKLIWALTEESSTYANALAVQQERWAHTIEEALDRQKQNSGF